LQFSAACPNGARFANAVAENASRMTGVRVNQIATPLD
jgi:hypothetical protein